MTGGRVRCADPMRARRPRSQERVTFATPLSAPSLRSLLGIAVAFVLGTPPSLAPLPNLHLPRPTDYFNRGYHSGALGSPAGQGERT